MSNSIYGYFGGERERTYKLTNFDRYDPDRVAGLYDMPVLQPETDGIPERIIGFNYAKSAKDTDCGVHFFVDDYQFERLWNCPSRVIERLKPFQCVFTPDFSVYLDMPMALKIWNVYRARLIGQMMQDAGLRVFTTLTWAGEDTYAFCFDGVPCESVVAVSTVGVARDKEARQLWYAGMTAAIEKLRPAGVLCYGANIGYDFGSTPVRYYSRRKIGLTAS